MAAAQCNSSPGHAHAPRSVSAAESSAPPGFRRKKRQEPKTAYVRSMKESRAAKQPPTDTIRFGLQPRTIYFPAGFLARVETRPGALVELLTTALAAYLQEGGGQ